LGFPVIVHCSTNKQTTTAATTTTTVQSASTPSQPNPPASHTFLQFNVNGLKNSLMELNSFLHIHKVKIACIQETRLSAKSKDPSFPEYTLLRRDCPVGNGGGVAILIHQSVSFSPLDVSAITQGDNVIELLGVLASINGSLVNVFNVYVPSASSCPSTYKLDLNSLLSFSDSNTVIMGDMNAHQAA
jgi:exonuclease III